MRCSTDSHLPPQQHASAPPAMGGFLAPWRYTISAPWMLPGSTGAGTCWDSRQNIPSLPLQVQQKSQMMSMRVQPSSQPLPHMQQCSQMLLYKCSRFLNRCFCWCSSALHRRRCNSAELSNTVVASAAELSTAASCEAVFSDAALQMQQDSEPLSQLVQQCTLLSSDRQLVLRLLEELPLDNT